ncbi:MAG: arylamine N-acetyltransferase [Candidatus Krumholzibacteria bacterium]|nr:arylamine N-acetyltransferase [Candidatus Krumholzibacteria bacterium]
MVLEVQSAKEIFFEHFRIPGGDPGLEMLRQIVSCYSDIPYENLTKIMRKFTVEKQQDRLRRPVEVMTGYVEQHTGGTCFSLTYCLGSILSSSGYNCYPVMADMKRPNIHCALVVHLGNKRYIVDPGYLLGEPVELAGIPVSFRSSFGTVELRPRSAARYDLYTVTGSERKWRYRVKTEPVSQALFMRYWQESFSLPMMNSLQLTKLTPDGHLYIRSHHLRLRRADMRLNENIRSNLESRIEAEFGIPGAITAAARENLERMKRSWHIHEQGGPGKRLR